MLHIVHMWIVSLELKIENVAAFCRDIKEDRILQRFLKAKLIKKYSCLIFWIVLTLQIDNSDFWISYKYIFNVKYIFVWYLLIFITLFLIRTIIKYSIIMIFKDLTVLKYILRLELLFQNSYIFMEFIKAEWYFIYLTSLIIEALVWLHLLI